MSTLKLVNKNNNIQELELSNEQVTNPTLKINNKYAPLIEYTESDYPLKVKHNNKEYGFGLPSYTVTITQSANQTITVTAGGKSYTSTFTAVYGTTYTVSIKANNGYKSGTLNTISGTITENVSISASAAQVDGVKAGSMTLQSLTTSKSFIIPNNVNYIKISIDKIGSVIGYVHVTPGKQYKFNIEMASGVVGRVSVTNAVSEVKWFSYIIGNGIDVDMFILSWSDEINKPPAGKTIVEDL